MNIIDKEKQIPDEFKELAKDFADKGFITTSFDNLVNWARTGSLHWMTFGSVSYTHLTLPTILRV